jgi:hypothetical protein
MKKFRVVYRPFERANDSAARSEEHYADGWRTDVDSVYLYERHNGEEVRVFDVPKSLIMRIHEVV